MATSTSRVNVPAYVAKLLNDHNQLSWKDFTPERVSSISREIEKNYVNGVGIQAADICRIFYVYNQSRKKYEGICYHLFDLVATKDGKGHVYFVKRSEIGNTEFPVIPSKWHNLDKVIKDKVESDSSSEISVVRTSLENQWSGSFSSSSSDSSSSISPSELSSVLSALTEVSSKLSSILSKLV